MSRGRRFLFLATFGLGGVVLLLWLGFWQLSRLEWKQELIADIEARAGAAPLTITGQEREPALDHRAAVAVGRFTAGETPIRYLTSVKGVGPGFRLIAPFELENGRRVLVDRGFAPEQVAPREGPAPAPPEGPQTLSGRLRWPNEASFFTPAPNQAQRLFFARDVSMMAEILDAEPVMLVLAEQPGAAQSWPRPQPEVIDLPNDHLGYAVTWFSLAAIWLAMSAILGFRSRAA